MIALNVQRIVMFVIRQFELDVVYFAIWMIDRNSYLDALSRFYPVFWGSIQFIFI